MLINTYHPSKADRKYFLTPLMHDRHLVKLYWGKDISKHKSFNVL